MRASPRAAKSRSQILRNLVSNAIKHGGWSNFVLTLPLASEEQIAAARRDLLDVAEEPPLLTIELFEEEGDDLATLGPAGSTRPLETRTSSNLTVDF